MSKTQKERIGSRQAGDEKELIPVRYQHAVAIALLFLSIVLFFNQITFGGKTFLDVDTIASHAFDTFLADAKKAGIFPLWNPYIFCGMPAYGSLTVGGERMFDLTALALGKASELFSLLLFNPPPGWVFFFYFVFACGMYLFTYSKLKSKFAAFVAAFAATFSMYIIIWVMTGHNTKIAVIAFFPYILYSIEKLRERFSIPLALVLVLLLHYSFLPSHVQMIFYMYLAVGVYFLFFLVRSLIKRKDATGEAASTAGWKPIVRTGVVFALASLLAFSMDADKYLSVWEYSSHSIRGSNPIVPSTQQAEAKTVEGGLGYDYATSWSFSPGELMTWLVPSWYGFGYQKYQGIFSNNQLTMANFYWGPQPFTHAPQYMGLIVFLLAVIGFIKNRKDPFVQYLGVMILLSLLIAFGKEFPLVYDLMYRYFPMFNKFRIPSMILVLVQIFIPILAAYGIVSLMKRREELHGAALQKRKKSVLVAIGVSIVICLALAAAYESLLPRQGIQNLFSTVFRYELPRDRIVEQIYRQIPAQVSTQLVSHVTGLVRTDLYLAIGMLVVSFGSLYYFIQGKLKPTTFSVILTLVIAFDLWRVAYKPMDPQDKAMQQQVFRAPDYVDFLQKDPAFFRVLEFREGQPPYDNTPAYWRIQNAYGYQGAKMRGYQDIVDVVGLYNPLVWGLMNVKYIISDRPDSNAALGLVYNGAERKVYSNLSALPRAFFVNRYEVTDAVSILSKIRDNSFDPRDVAFFVEDPKLQIEPPHPAARAEFLSYGIQDMELKLTTSGSNLLFLSETYYPKGWKAYIDGKETPIYRANYLFRAVVAPPGIHKLEMKIEPTGFYLGKNLSLLGNLLVLGGLAYLGVDRWMKRRREGGRV
ncbi:MAG: YfhO family protein [Bacteroidota bacterium]